MYAVGGAADISPRICVPACVSVYSHTQGRRPCLAGSRHIFQLPQRFARLVSVSKHVQIRRA